MTDQRLIPFCANPKCRLHSVKVLPECSCIERETPSGKETCSRIRYDLNHTVNLCETCHEAVQMVALASMAGDIGEEEKTELWTPSEKVIILQ